MRISLKPRVKLFAAMGIVLTATVGVTLAAFTDTGNVQTSFTAGSLDLKFDDGQDGNPTNHLVNFSEGFDKLVPGDKVVRDLRVYNSGTIGAVLDLAVPQITNSAGASTPALQDNLTLVITDVTVSGSPVTLYTGPLSKATFTALAIGTAERTLHLAVTLDASASVRVAGQTISVVFPFVASQA